jgi:hypothetical protein
MPVVRYHCLAPCLSWRDWVIPKPPQTPKPCAEAPASVHIPVLRDRLPLRPPWVWAWTCQTTSDPWSFEWRQRADNPHNYPSRDPERTADPLRNARRKLVARELGRRAPIRSCGPKLRSLSPAPRRHRRPHPGRPGLPKALPCPEKGSAATGIQVPERTQGRGLPQNDPVWPTGELTAAIAPAVRTTG